MKRITMTLMLLLTAIPAHANPTTDAKAHVTKARQELQHARAELKAAKLHDKAEKRAKSKARSVARARARLAKALASDAALGCGPCVDTHDGSCTCPPADDRVFGVQTDPPGY